MATLGHVPFVVIVRSFVAQSLKIESISDHFVVEEINLGVIDHILEND